MGVRVGAGAGAGVEAEAEAEVGREEWAGEEWYKWENKGGESHSSENILFSGNSRLFEGDESPLNKPFFSPKLMDRSWLVLFLEEKSTLLPNFGTLLTQSRENIDTVSVSVALKRFGKG